MSADGGRCVVCSSAVVTSAGPDTSMSISGAASGTSSVGVWWWGWGWGGGDREWEGGGEGHSKQGPVLIPVCSTWMCCA
jgi:hypothetical protein